MAGEKNDEGRCDKGEMRVSGYKASVRGGEGESVSLGSARTVSLRLKEKGNG